MVFSLGVFSVLSFRQGSLLLVEISHPAFFPDEPNARPSHPPEPIQHAGLMQCNVSKPVRLQQP